LLFTLVSLLKELILERRGVLQFFNPVFTIVALPEIYCAWRWGKVSPSRKQNTENSRQNIKRSENTEYGKQNTALRSFDRLRTGRQNTEIRGPG